MVDSPFWSKFGGLAIDRKNIDTSALSEPLRHFVRDGYVILKGAADHSAIDRFLEDVSVLRRQRGLLLGQGPDNVITDPPQELRILDIHVNAESAHTLMFAPIIREFLEAIFESEALAFQSLLFTYGSEQGMHQDPAYVIVDPPLHLAASWIALEDVTLGSGELVYNVGSHRNEDFAFAPNRQYYLPPEDGLERHETYSRHLEQQRIEKGQKQETFRANKGDALIWHADLVHGGSARTTSATRRSLVTHYCPVTATPHYFNWKGFTTTLPTNGGYVSSMWYDLTSTQECNIMSRRYPSL